MDPARPSTDRGVRRALARAGRGVALDLAEVTALLGARGDDLRTLMSYAARVRDAGLVDAGRPGQVTYSPKVFIPLTRLCRDRCHYCTFVTVPGKLAAAGQAPYLSPDEVLRVASQGAELGCAEALFTLGDCPEDRWPEARQWLEEHGYDSTLDYVRAMSVRVLEETGLLPHLNPGVMSWAQMHRLKPVAPSMGMMLETTSRRLFTEKGQPHFGSPDKDPDVRLRVLEDAGRLSIPFTTGLLVGIGETLQERAESIFALRRVATAYGHVQEVIVQNFRSKPDTAMRSVGDLEVEEYLAAVAVTRLVMGPRMRVQAPPNLVDLAECRDLLAAGVDDWGGVSPLTPDHVNPERPWPTLDRLGEVTADSGFELRARLTAHPRYVLAGDPWIDPRVRPHVAALAGPDGLLADGVRPQGLPWQEPDGGALSGDEHAAGWGRTDLHTTIDTTGRTTDRRTDFDDVYGDWATLRAQVNPTTATPPSTSQTADPATDGPAPVAPNPATKGGPSAPGPSAPVADTPGPVDLPARASEGGGAGAGVDGTGPPGATKERKGWLPAPVSSPSVDRSFASAMTQAETDPTKLTDEQALTLFTADGHELDAVRALADHLRHETVGDDVTYVLNRNINFTNVCYTGCRFCAFAQRRTDADAFSLSLEQVADHAEEAWALGATEVCMQGGIDPELPGTAYFDLASAVKRRVPQMHVHAFSPMEVVNGATRTGLSIHDWLLKAKESGLDSIPGTAAEILDDEVRWVLTKGKLPTSAWVEVVSTAHRLGIRSSSTMMYGHVDRPEHWVTHLRVIQRVQDAAREQGVAGFTEFVPLPFVHTSAPIYLAGVARPGPSLRDNLAVHAVARIMLHGRIDHIQTSWVKLGVDGTRLMLESGCDDLGGTLMEETISRMAGSEHGSAKTVAELTEIAAGIGRRVRQRTTTYDEVPARA